MNEPSNGNLILKSVNPQNEAAIVDFLAGLFKKAKRETLTAYVKKAPTVLARGVPEAQARKIVARLIQLGAEAEFESAAPPPPPLAPVAAPSPEASEAEADASESQAGPEPGAAKTVVCSQCGRSFAEDDVLTYNDMLICAQCKPAFVQKLKEGERIGGQLVYAGFWIRAGAKIVDGIIILAIGFVAALVINFLESMVKTDQIGMINLVVVNLVKIVLAAAYTIYFIGKFAATPGKMACGLKIVMPDGDRVSYARATGRYFAEWISSMIMGIGYIMAGFDEEKRALHDRICSTRVVRK